MHPFRKAYLDIQDLLNNWTDSASEFSSYLRRNRIPHLSFTRVSTLKSCPYRYYLVYIKAVELDPPPEYFTKGKILHEAAAMLYSDRSQGRMTNPTSLADFVLDRAEGTAKQHLLNAVHELQRNAWKDWEIISIEKPFVLEIGDELPPCVGVIDLLLKKGDKYAVVDHKTGRSFFQTDFFDPDRLQMAIYREYVERTFSPQECLSFYDKYRWVNSLKRIRKPAFEREEIRLTNRNWDTTHRQLADSFHEMRSYYVKKQYPKDGNCFVCPYRDLC